MGSGMSSVHIYQAENKDFQDRISSILGDNQFNWPAQEIVEQRIYDGFPSDADKLWRDRFELAPWAEKAKLIEGFEDDRYRELAERIIGLSFDHINSDVSPIKLQNTYIRKTYASRD